MNPLIGCLPFRRYHEQPVRELSCLAVGIMHNSRHVVCFLPSCGPRGSGTGSNGKAGRGLALSRLCCSFRHIFVKGDRVAGAIDQITPFRRVRFFFNLCLALAAKRVASFVSSMWCGSVCFVRLFCWQPRLFFCISLWDHTSMFFCAFCADFCCVFWRAGVFVVFPGLNIALWRRGKGIRWGGARYTHS